MTRRTLTRAALLIAATTCTYAAHHPKVNAELEGKSLETPLNVIIQYKQGAQQRHINAVTSRGGHHRGTLDVVKGAAFSVSAGALEDLANDPDVERIVPDRPISAMATVTPDYKLQAVNADLAQSSGWTGAGIGVAVIDSGIFDKPDLHGAGGFRVVYSQNFLTGGTGSDGFGHGTHVAGIVGGTGGQSSGVYAGVAPAVNFINLLVLDPNTGSTVDSVVISAIQRAIQLKSQYNIRVINLSLGRPVFESYTIDPLCQAVEAAWKAGIVVVVAAGNEGRNNTANTNGYASITAPGNDPYVITVGAMNVKGSATRSDDVIASYSSKGPTLFDHVAKPDLVAPGNRLVSVLAGGSLSKTYKSNITASAYFMLSGTSMAAPMVSGTVALMLQQTPSLTPDQVKARLMKTAYKTFPTSSVATDPATGIRYTSNYDIFTVGAGYLDTLAALNSTDTATGSALSPVAIFNAATNTTTLSNIAGQSVIWGTNVIWGTSVIWGTNIVAGSSVIWGTNVIWGTSSMAGNSVIWGTNVIWGTSTSPAGESTAIAINGEQ